MWEILNKLRDMVLSSDVDIDLTHIMKEASVVLEKRDTNGGFFSGIDGSKHVLVMCEDLVRNVVIEYNKGVKSSNDMLIISKPPHHDNQLGFFNSIYVKVENVDVKFMFEFNLSSSSTDNRLLVFNFFRDKSTYNNYDLVDVDTVIRSVGYAITKDFRFISCHSRDTKIGNDESMINSYEVQLDSSVGMDCDIQLGDYCMLQGANIKGKYTLGQNSLIKVSCDDTTTFNVGSYSIINIDNFASLHVGDNCTINVSGYGGDIRCGKNCTVITEVPCDIILECGEGTKHLLNDGTLQDLEAAIIIYDENDESDTSIGVDEVKDDVTLLDYINDCSEVTKDLPIISKLLAKVNQEFDDISMVFRPLCIEAGTKNGHTYLRYKNYDSGWFMCFNTIDGYIVNVSNYDEYRQEFDVIEGEAFNEITEKLGKDILEILL